MAALVFFLLVWTARGLFHSASNAHRISTENTLLNALSASDRAPADCICADRSLCDRIRVSHDKEFFGFIYPFTKNFRLYNWTHITAVAWHEDPELVCVAHSHQARVILNSGDVSHILTDTDAQITWVINTVQHILNKGLDGVNFDYESPLAPGSDGSLGYAQLVGLTSLALKAVAPGAQVSVDVPWSPFDIDGRNYEWAALALAADLLFVMAYDTQSQIWGRCIASANTPLALAERGLRQWLALGVPPNKLVLGLPWYGYDYDCLAPQKSSAPAAQQGSDVGHGDICELRPIPFVGAPCSDAAGVQHPFSEIMAMLAPGGVNTTGPVKWDGVQVSEYFEYASPVDGALHQVWFDSPRSLRPKYELARRLGLRGIGCWNLEHLYSPDPGTAAPDQVAAMWQALDVFFE